MKVDFITFCHQGDIHRLYHGDWLDRIIRSHEYRFNNLYVIHQRCTWADIVKHNQSDLDTVSILSRDYPKILSEFGLPEDDPIADEYTHGPGAPHYWKWHTINHLIGLKVSSADYIVFSDNDCLIRSHDPEYNWIKRGIEILKRYREVLIVSPGDGATMAEAQLPNGYRCTQNVSQQLFLCERKRMLDVDFNIDWGGAFNAPGGPMQEYYFMLEGRIWRYLDRYGLWRCILPDYVARYWHCNRLTDDGFFEGDYSKY